ncbi:MAG: ABC transporter substrate-binding protein [Flavobacteriia bacterium]|jgi:phospholipid transport system substrate-binding protein|nr:ABC transporter substrate-binding protein [Flavobacteriia bacterium]
MKIFTYSYFMFVLFCSNLVFGQTSDAASDVRSLMESRDQQIKQLLGPEGTSYSSTQRDELKDIVNGIIDFTEMAKTALEVTYDTISVAERTEFVQLFSSIIRDQSLANLDIYRASVSYERIKGSNDSIYVETLAEWDNIRTPVHYIMSKSTGKWRIEDMSIDDVFTAASYNKQFQRIIRSRGFDYLMTTLRKRAERNS